MEGIMRKESITEKDITPPVVCTAPWRLNAVKPLEDYRLEVSFIDGTQGIVEMKQLIHSQNAGVFSQLKDIKIFNQAYLEHGAVTWPGGFDLAPDAMHAAIKKNGSWILE